MYIQEGLSIVAIAQHLTEAGVPTPNEQHGIGPRRKRSTGVWQPSSLYDLLSNEAYIGTLYYSGFTNLSSMPCSDLGCWVSYEDTLPSTPRAEHRPSVPGCGGGAESDSPLAFGHSLLYWRRADCHDDRAVSPNQREPGSRCPALRGLSALGLASGGARDGAGRVLPRRHV